MRSTSIHCRRAAMRPVVCALVVAAAPAALTAACGGGPSAASPGASAAAGPAGASASARPPSSVPVIALVMHPRHTAGLYAALPGGLFWTTDHATSWRPVPAAPPGYYLGVWVGPQAAVHALRGVRRDHRQPLPPDQVERRRLHVDGLTDGGAPQPSGYVPKIWLGDRESGPAAIYLVPLRGEGLYRSLDRGDTWVRLRGAASRRAWALRDRVRPLPAAAQRAVDAFMVPFRRTGPTGRWR